MAQDGALTRFVSSDSALAERAAVHVEVAVRYARRTAVPEAVTISMEPPWPTVS
jgi:hypothetical protein